MWGKKDKVKYTTIILNKEQGGLKFPDVEFRIRAQHILWMKQIFNENTHNWKHILHAATKGDYKNITLGNTTSTHAFLNNIIQSKALYAPQELDRIDILSQRFKYNKNLLIGNKLVINQ